MGSDKVLESGKKIAKFHLEHPEEKLIEDPDENFFLYSVRSTPRGQAYGVMLDDNGVYDCACPYFEFKGQRLGTDYAKYLVEHLRMLKYI